MVIWDDEVGGFCDFINVIFWNEYKECYVDWVLLKFVCEIYMFVWFSLI